ncbi:MAG TPA: aminotransferase class I/II-fold pyridoxal phosphate-dependent enzyme [Gemmatimonadaceae bacterium]|nr:aminotransferase class I/II-fold pyridoxal phosphate-dependent enzyme [Gemmatimonadaceae bacterium]
MTVAPALAPSTPVVAPTRTSLAPDAHFSARTRRLGTENAFKIGPYIREVESAGYAVTKCNLGEPDFALPKHIADEVKRAIDADMTHYVDPQGILPLREAIAARTSAKRGITVTPDRVVVFPGAKPPIGFSQQTYCDAGDEVVYPSPGFPIYESFTGYLDARPVPLHLREEAGFSFSGRDLAPLISARTRLIILNFPSNPTGGVATPAQLESIADVIRRDAPPNVRVYSDEVYEDILFDGNRHFSIASLPGMAERTIIVGGVSKSYAWTGGRVGWAVLPTAEEATVFKNLNINYFSCVSAYSQMGAKAALESAESDESIARMVAAFQERRDVVVAGLNAIPGITCNTPGGAFYLFPNIAGVCEELGAIDAYGRLTPAERERTSPATLFQMFLLFRHHVATLDRRSFGRIGADGQHYLRLSIATSLQELERGVERIRRAAADRDGFRDFVSRGERLW